MIPEAFIAPRIAIIVARPESATSIITPQVWENSQH
jgi:hypothetical protein